MQPFDILFRTFPIRTFISPSRSTYGTALILDVDCKQYLVTAAHIVPPSDNEHITYDLYGPHKERDGDQGAWHRVRQRIIGIDRSSDVDLAVTTVGVPIVNNSPISTRLKMLKYGQEVYYFGFPQGFNLAPILGRSAPFVRRATISMNLIEGNRQMFLDGYSAPGFSGGPVIIYPNTDRDVLVGVVTARQQFTEGLSSEGNKCIKAMDLCVLHTLNMQFR